MLRANPSPLSLAAGSQKGSQQVKERAQGWGVGTEEGVKGAPGHKVAMPLSSQKRKLCDTFLLPPLLRHQL